MLIIWFIFALLKRDKNLSSSLNEILKLKPHDWLHVWPHDWLRTRVQKKHRKGIFFRHWRHQRFPEKRGVFFILHRTLGVPSSKNVRHVIQSDILGYHLGLCFASVTPFRVQL